MKTKLWKKIVGSACFLLMMSCNVVKAEEVVNPLESILKDGFFYIDTLKPSQISMDDLNALLKEQYKDFLADNETNTNQEIQITSINSPLGEAETADFIYTSCEVDGGCGSVSYTLPIEWKTSDLYASVVPNGQFEMNAIYPSGYEDLDPYVNTSLTNKYNEGDIYGWLYGCNEDYSACYLSLSYFNSDSSESYHTEDHFVKLLWKEADANGQKRVLEYASKINNMRESDGSIVNFEVNDLNLIHYYSQIAKNNISEGGSVIRYAEDFRKIFDYSNLSYTLDVRMGDVDPLYGYAGGYFVIYYNGIAYGSVDSVGVYQNHILYIPDETENTSDAYMAAAKKRIDDYLGDTNTKIELGGKISDLDSAFDFSSLGDVSKIGDYFYNVTIGSVTKTFIFVKDSSKIPSTPIVETKDLDTNIVVSTDSPEVPLDTAVKVQEIHKDMEEFTSVQNVLKFKDEKDVQIYDLKLYSESAKEFIKKLDSGKFQVSIPVKESLKGKTLFAYYVRENGKVEEYPVTLKDGIATFMTSHFSIYTLSEKLDVDLAEDVINENVPKTVDSIESYVFLGAVGIFGLLGTFALKKKFN